MLSVQEIRRRKLQKRPKLTGLIPTITGVNGNNNANKRSYKISFQNTADFMKKLIRKKTGKERSSKKEENSLSPTPDPEFVSNVPYTDTVGGEEVIVNYIEVHDEAEQDLEMDCTHTPDDYANTYDYYFHINENNKDIYKAINRLGEMVLFYEIAGDIDDWALHLEMLEIERKKWKRRCRKSNEYFEKTGKVLGVEEKKIIYKIKKFVSEKAEHLSDYVKGVLSRAKEACPLFGTACPCLFSSELHRVRSVYSDSWHFDEPVPDMFLFS